MLTREHALADFDYQRGIVVPDRLTRATHAGYVALAEQMLQIYRDGTGQLRRDLHRRVSDLFEREEDCPLRRVRAFCKLLDDRAEYDFDAAGRAAELRQQVFRLAAPRHPLRKTRSAEAAASEGVVKREIGRVLGEPWIDLESRLFADVPEFQRLQRFPGYPSGESLLARYNVAQFQAALFDAISLTVWVCDDFKAILRYAKLARLMHTIRQLPEGTYQFRFDGPASVLRETRRYGAAFARFLPGLLACRGWKLHAVIASGRGGRPLSLDLRDSDGLRSQVPSPAEFDSKREEQFAASFEASPRNGWTLIREGEVLHAGQRVFVPDFVLQHVDGRRVLLEIVGFWTPEYLAAKRETLRRFEEAPILLAVAHSVKQQLPELPANTVIYKTRLLVSDVLTAVEKLTR